MSLVCLSGMFLGESVLNYLLWFVVLEVVFFFFFLIKTSFYLKKYLISFKKIDNIKNN